ncbi:BamA/OMP85 family outer membrane protein [Blattabacterium cuenoti]|uniref:BamA/OMP85 family outer membrane protein n=1 Tax=Blattabacterium cuenoti TaxID=1653831 RepID=UPI00163BE543|nr:POTRA domain-containing protein [Blattabacterium cuenoti]
MKIFLKNIIYLIILQLVYSFTNNPFTTDNNLFTTDNNLFITDSNPFNTDNNPFNTDNNPFNTDNNPFNNTDNNSFNIIQKNENNNSNLIVKNINIIGKTKYDNIFISNLSGIYVGDIIDIYGIKIGRIVKKLWKSNLFHNISVYKKHLSKNEINLFFELEDLIELHGVEIKGIEKNKFTSIKNIKYGDKISENLIQTIKNDIKTYYKKRGYNEICIESEIKSNNNKNILYIYVNKGKKIQIEKILFYGNKIISDKDLFKIMTEFKRNYYIPIIEKPIHLFIQENIENNLKNIKNKYKSLGYRDIEVFLDSVSINNSGNYEIKVKLVEGKKYYIGNISIVGNKKLKTDFLKKILFYKEGDIYNKNEIKKNILDASFSSSMIYAYLDIGHLFVNIIFLEKKVEDNKIHLEIKIEENNPIYINKVEISGNKITKDYIIKRELDTYTGDLFSPKKIKYSYTRLENLNLFEKIFFKIRSKKNNTIDIVWNVVEKNSNIFQFHGGLGSKDIKKIIGSFKLNFNNFSVGNFFKWNLWNPIPQGEGQKLIIFHQLGKDFKSYGFSFTEPYVNIINPISITLKSDYSINIMKNEEIFPLQNKYKILYDKNKKQYLEKVLTSIDLESFLTFIDPYSKIRVSMDYEKFLYKKEIFSNFYHNFKFKELSFLFLLQRIDTKPDVIFPFQGSKIEFSSKFTFPYFIFNKKKNMEWIEFFKFQIVSSWYKKIINNIVLKIGGEFGYLGQYDDSKELFSFQKFYMGGVQNNLFGLKLGNKNHIPLRGYYFNKNNIGVIYDKLILEMRYLIKNFSHLKMWTTLFMEGGNISNSYKEFNPFIINKSCGFGFRFFWTPIGFVGIDFGYPINIDISSLNTLKSKWKIHFLIGKDL